MIDGFDHRQLLAALTPRRHDPFATPATGRDAAGDGGNPRARLDTVTLSENGQKIVNLNRARELGAELRAEKDPVAFREKLRLAMEDIRRIGKLFGEVIASLSRRPRPPLG